MQCTPNATCIERPGLPCFGQCVVLIDQLTSGQLDVHSVELEKKRSHTHAHAASTLKLHAHLPCLHAELGKKCLATCPGTWFNRKQLDCGGARLVVGVLIVQPSFLAEQHILVRLVDWSEGHPAPLGSANIALEPAVPPTRLLKDYDAPFSCQLELHGRRVGELTGRLNVVWSGATKGDPRSVASGLGGGGGGGASERAGSRRNLSQAMRRQTTSAGSAAFSACRNTDSSHSPSGGGGGGGDRSDRGTDGAAASQLGEASNSARNSSGSAASTSGGDPSGSGRKKWAAKRFSINSPGRGRSTSADSGFGGASPPFSKRDSGDGAAPAPAATAPLPPPQGAALAKTETEDSMSAHRV